MPPLFSPLRITCRVRAGHIATVDIAPRALPPVSALLRGKTPAQALASLSAVFSLCRHGQCLAASRAVCAALDVPPAPAWARLLRAVRDVEMLREHCLNLLRLPGWPLPPPKETARLLAALNGLHQALSAGSGARLFVPDGAVLTPDRAALMAHGQDLREVLDNLLGGLGSPPLFAEHTASPSSPLGQFFRNLDNPAAFGCVMPARLPARLPEADVWVKLMEDAGTDFSLYPIWSGQPGETGCYSRRYHYPALESFRRVYGHGLATRTWARILEIHALWNGLKRRLAWLDRAGSLTKPTPRRADGIGLGQVQTARGLLVHALEMRDGLISEYRMVAPTEWNFHPRGLLADVLTGYPAADAAVLREDIGLFLRILDPCVDFELDVVDVPA